MHTGTLLAKRQNCAIFTTCQMKPKESNKHYTHATLQDGSLTSCVTVGKLMPETADMNHQQPVLLTTNAKSNDSCEKVVNSNNMATLKSNAGMHYKHCTT